jgi:magnesium-transporting ATPase (P-type)
LTKHDWLEALLFAVAVAVGLTPEILPMIVTVNLAKGAITMAREKVIVKRLTAIQNIGAVNVLCADKTGTLRQDRITRYRLGWPSVKNRIGELPEERATARPNHHARTTTPIAYPLTTLAPMKHMLGRLNGPSTPTWVAWPNFSAGIDSPVSAERLPRA